MPLISAMLKPNNRLRDCLVDDAAHVTPGSKGAHVSLIQKCLLVLDKAQIAQTEISSAVYGPTTAAAVLTYKRARGIINRNYQTAADNIVGKMTVQRLDAEIARAELAPDRCVSCLENGGPPAPARPFAFAGSAVAAPVGAPPKPPGRNTIHRTLDVIVQRTSTAAGTDGLIAEFIDKAQKLLVPQNLSLPAGLALVPTPVNYPDNPFKAQIPVERTALRRAAVNAHLPGSNALRIIFVPFDPIFAKHGITEGGPDSQDTEVVPKYCLINTSNPNPDRCTMLHEMVHAAYKATSPIHDDGDPTSVYSISERRTQLPNSHAAVFANQAFFKI